MSCADAQSDLDSWIFGWCSMWDVNTSSRTAPFGIEKKNKKETCVNSRALLNHCSALTLCCEATIQRLCLCNTENNRLSLAHARTHLIESHSHGYRFPTPECCSTQTQGYFFSPCSRTDPSDLCVIEQCKPSPSSPRALWEKSLPCFFFFIFSSVV